MSKSKSRTKSKSLKYRIFGCFHRSNSQTDENPTIQIHPSNSSSPISNVPIIFESTKSNIQQSKSSILCQTFEKPSLIIPKQHFHSFIDERTNPSGKFQRIRFRCKSKRKDIDQIFDQNEKESSGKPKKAFILNLLVLLLLEFRFCQNQSENRIRDENFTRNKTIHHVLFDESFSSNSSSINEWKESVRRLNFQYLSTFDALEKMKNHFQQNDSLTKEKKIECSTMTETDHSIEFLKLKFNKPKLIRRSHLNLFPISKILETENEIESSNELVQRKTNEDFTSTIQKKISGENSQENENAEQSFEDSNSIEETIYTLETIYKKPHGNETIVIRRENITEEQFQLAKENSSLLTNSISINENRIDFH